MRVARSVGRLGGLCPSGRFFMRQPSPIRVPEHFLLRPINYNERCSNCLTRAGKKSQKVVKLCENADRAFEQVQRARFVRRRPPETQRVAPNVALLLIRARYYDPLTGEFTSRDPLEYVDGMSLYRGYFGIGGVDPFGLDWHHLLPQSSRQFFWGNGIDIDAPSWGWEIDSKLHSQLHPTWEQEWKDFFDGYDNPYDVPREDINRKFNQLWSDWDHVLQEGEATPGRFRGTKTNTGIPVDVDNRSAAGKRIRFLSVLAALGAAAAVCDQCVKTQGIADVLANGPAIRRARETALKGHNPYLDLIGKGYSKESVFEELTHVDMAFALCFNGIASQYFDSDGEIK